MQKIALLSLLMLSSILMKAQVNLDSLYTVWQDKTQPNLNRAQALDDYIWFGYVHSKPDSALILSDSLYSFSNEHGLKKIMANALNMKGGVYYIKSDFPNSLKNHQSSLQIRQELDDKKGIAASLNNIGLIYKNQSNFPQALHYWERSLKIYEEIGNKRGIGITLNNVGIIYRAQDNFPKALEYYQRSLATREEIGDKQGIGETLNNIGVIYFYQDNFTQAQDYYERSLKVHEEIDDKTGIALSLGNIGNMLNEQGLYKDAVIQCQRALEISKEIGDIDQQKETCECLYGAYKGLGNSAKALEYHEELTILNNSIFNEENTKKLTQLEMQYEFDKKEAETLMEQEKKDVIAAQELKRKNLERNGFMAGFAVVLLFAGVFFFQRNRIGKERERSENLLTNILPKEVAEELKNTGKAATKKYDNVSILFTDFKGFTSLVASIPATKLVEELNQLFGRFDDIMDEYEIEKIETIGDAYMAACGLPKENADHALRCVQAAREMIDFLKERNLTNDIQWNMRVGIHSGPVVAGVVGKKKFAYDLFGDSVNTASRMESNGEPEKINISQTTYELLKDEPAFTFENRGKILAKGKGQMEMYFVEKKKV